LRRFVLVAALAAAGCVGEPSCTLAGRWQGSVVLGQWAGTEIV
jgi:hypothetical protein